MLEMTDESRREWIRKAGPGSKGKSSANKRQDGVLSGRKAGEISTL
jgi:hypothetical protein